MGKTSLAVTKYCVPLHQLRECNICKSLGGDSLSIHMAFSQKTNGFWEIIGFFVVNKRVPLNKHGTCYVIGEHGQFTRPTQILSTNPVFRVGRKIPALKMSMLNAGGMFDIELPIAWNQLTSQVAESETLWVYIS